MREILVLCYHAISDRWPTSMAVTQDAFRAQLTVLADSGYRPATFTDAVLDPPRGKTAVVTFDDGYLSNYELAAPILEEFGFPATIFVPSAFPGSPSKPMSWPGIEEWLGSEHENELLPASWAQLRELADAGWEVGSHTRTHPKLPELDDAALNDELARSRQECEQELGLPCTSLAYPHGEHDRRVIRATGEAGYSAAATVPSPYHPAAPLRWPRVGIHGDDDLELFRRKIGAWRRRLRKNPLWWIVQLRRSAGR